MGLGKLVVEASFSHFQEWAPERPILHPSALRSIENLNGIPATGCLFHSYGKGADDAALAFWQ